MLILYLVMTYLTIGFLFSIVFVAHLVDRLDESAQGTSWVFRLMIIPGCIALWPVLLINIQKAQKKRK